MMAKQYKCIKELVLDYYDSDGFSTDETMTIEAGEIFEANNRYPYNIVGGNDCMVIRYKDICEAYNCKAKIFTQMPSDFDRKLGTPDLMVVFTNTCSHKMLNSVNQKSRKHDIPVARIHNASASALKSILNQYCN